MTRSLLQAIPQFAIFFPVYVHNSDQSRKPCPYCSLRQKNAFENHWHDTTHNSRLRSPPEKMHHTQMPLQKMPALPKVPALLKHFPLRSSRMPRTKGIQGRPIQATYVSFFNTRALLMFEPFGKLFVYIIKQTSVIPWLTEKKIQISFIIRIDSIAGTITVYVHIPA